MRNARRILGDVTVVGERRDHFSVPEARRAQHQPRGLEDGDTAFSESLRWDVFQTSHCRLLGFESCKSSIVGSQCTSESTEGEPASRLPLLEPDGPRRFGLNAGGTHYVSSGLL